MRGLLTLILLLLVFGLGIYVGNTYQVDILNLANVSLKEVTETVQEKVEEAHGNIQPPSHPAAKGVSAMCPSAEVVRQHVGQSGPFIVDGHSWSFASVDWQPPGKIEFNQAFYYPENQSIECNYTWPDPKIAGKLWLRISLNLPANQSVKQIGSHWVKTDNVTLCSSGTPNTCAFEIISN